MTQFNEVGPASEPEKPKKCPCKCRIIGIAILVFLIAGVVCWHVHRPKPIDPEIDLKPGTYCIVQLRRDSLGAAGSPVPPTTDQFNGAIVSMRGTLLAINRDAILLECIVDYPLNQPHEVRRHWIPKNNILLITHAPPTTQ